MDIKLNSYSKFKPCFFCGKNPPNGKEHIPPKIFFKGRIINNAFTIPACDTHNTEKSQYDQAIFYLFLKVFEWNKNKTNGNFDPIIEEIYEKEKGYFDYTKSVLESRNFLIDPPNGVDNSLPYLSKSPIEWLVSLSVGMIWKLTGFYDSKTNWNYDKVFFSDFISDRLTLKEYFSYIKSKHNELEKMDNLSWVNGWSIPYPPEIYFFNLAYTKKKEFVIHHKFFNTFDCYVFFEASRRVQKILNRVVSPKVKLNFIQ